MDHYLEINGHEYQARTEYDYTPGYKGSFQDGLQVEPDEDPEIELGRTEITVEDGDKASWHYLPLTESFDKEITEEAWEHLRDGL